MPDLDEAYGFDKEEAKGKWFTVRGIKVKLAFLHSTELVAKLTKEKEEYANTLDHEPTVDEAEQVGVKFFAEHVLLDWDKDLTVKGIAYSPSLENKIQLLNDYPLFQRDCFAVAQSNQKFQHKKIENRVKK